MPSNYGEDYTHEADPTPISTNETYSAIETEINPSYELQKTEGTGHHACK